MTLNVSISSVEWCFFTHDMGEKSTLVDFFSIEFRKILLTEPGGIKLLLFFEFLVVSFYFTKKLWYLKRKIKPILSIFSDIFKSAQFLRFFQ